MYKEALMSGMRVQTPKGNLSVEQLFGLTLNELDSLAVTLEESYKNSKGKSFLDKRTSKDKGLKLQFDIVLDILNTKMEIAEGERETRENKEHNQKILSLIAEKQEGELKGKTIKELEAMLK